jgi:hypothetical protein
MMGKIYYLFLNKQTGSFFGFLSAFVASLACNIFTNGISDLSFYIKLSIVCFFFVAVNFFYLAILSQSVYDNSTSFDKHTLINTINENHIGLKSLLTLCVVIAYLCLGFYSLYVSQQDKVYRTSFKQYNTQFSTNNDPTCYALSIAKKKN